jgi:hypothetical protein
MQNPFVIALAIVVVLILMAALAVRWIGGNFTLIEDWKKAWKFYSTWMLALIAILPDLWNSIAISGITDSGDVPSAFSYTLKGGVFVALLLRQVKQVKQSPNLPDFDNDGKPG